MSVRVEIPPGKAVAGCCGCGEVFTCVSAFDHHQHLRPEAEGGSECLEPSSRGLVLYEREVKGEIWGLWGWPAADAGDPWYDEVLAG